MNKNVLEYLNDKILNVADNIRAKSESVGNYITSHAKNIKKGAIRATATALTAATLIGGLTACEIETLTQLEVRPIEEIEETGIKAEDVLALYDNMAKNYFERLYGNFSDSEKAASIIKYEFTNITPLESAVPTTEDYLFGPFETIIDPFYYSLDTYTIVSWLAYDTTKLSNICPINFNYKAYSKDNVFDYQVTACGISPADLNSIIEAFNLKPFEITPEYIDSLGYAAISYQHLTGKTAYPSLTINRELIENANEQQLWSLYNAATNSIYSINFEAKQPEDNIIE